MPNSIRIETCPIYGDDINDFSIMTGKNEQGPFEFEAKGKRDDFLYVMSISELEKRIKAEEMIIDIALEDLFDQVTDVADFSTDDPAEFVSHLQSNAPEVVETLMCSLLHKHNCSRAVRNKRNWEAIRAEQKAAE